MAAKTPSILIVDDEDMVLSSLRGVFALQTDYEVHEANTPSAAIGTLERTPIDVVISDFLMPEMNGLELLKEVKRIQPETVRLLLTGYADKENAIKAINDVGLYQYIEKPWENDDLKIVLRNGLEKRLLMKRLEDKIAEVNKAHGELMNLQKDILKVFA